MEQVVDSNHELLVSRAQRGDLAAFDLLFRQIEDDLFRVAVRITRDDTEAEEALQNALLTIFRKIDSFRGEAKFTTWAHRIGVNAALQLLRRKKRRPQIVQAEFDRDCEAYDYLERLYPDDTSCPHDSYAIRQFMAQIDAEVEDLPELDRKVFQLYVYEDLTMEEVADRLGITMSAAKSRLHRARKQVRALVGGPWLN